LTQPSLEAIVGIRDRFLPGQLPPLGLNRVLYEQLLCILFLLANRSIIIYRIQQSLGLLAMDTEQLEASTEALTKAKMERENKSSTHACRTKTKSSDLHQF